MEFDFLPNLPKSDLDDRTFKDLVEECILRIPRYCPEWTNHNPSDPGITLIELFAWLTDQMLLRFNQVPRRHYVAFLELLGIRLQPPTPAQTAVTFYLTRPQSERERFPAIPPGTEVATERTETAEAVVFSTEDPLEIGIPRIRHFLTAETRETRPQFLSDRLSNLWRQETDGSWAGRKQPVFRLLPQVGNCFYLAFEPDEPLDGNVIRLNITGEPAGSTGIDPEHPPRYWEAWDGVMWRPILLNELDDGTRGFSFGEVGQAATSTIRSGDVTLHLPLPWPATTFASYRGRWLRCVYTKPQERQAAYNRSPQFTALSAVSTGGTAITKQCTIIHDELLGESDGTPGQIFQLHSDSILPRQDNEHLIVIPPGEFPQTWEEVENFSESEPSDRHYVLDSTTGHIQFGPLIRESEQLRESLAQRHRIQKQGQNVDTTDLTTLDALERQYGAVPLRGASVRMSTYRTGGGLQGNVERETVRIVKSAVPYVSRVTNYQPARGGANAESLDEAVIRVPSFLRTQERAVTPEDFETLTHQSSRAVARAFCPTEQTQAGVVEILVVPRVVSSERHGLSPEQLQLSPDLSQTIREFLDKRRLLGIDIQLETPTYVGVSVQAEIVATPEYRNPLAQQSLQIELETQLYQFLNPIVGGELTPKKTGKGWGLGMPVRESDIVPIFQQFNGVSYLKTLQIFGLYPQPDGSWIRRLARDGMVNPGPLGLICSWNDSDTRSAHVISLAAA